MANLFYSGLMVSDQIDAKLAGALVLDGSNNEIAVKDGALVVLGDLVPDTTYVASGDFEYNAYKAKAPAAVTDEVCIVDYAGISGGEIRDNYYKMGVKLFGLEAPAGEIVRVRRLELHDKFWLGADNFESAPTVGQFAELKASSFKHDPKAALTGGQYGVKILKEEDLTTGMESNGKKYLVEVVAL